jgi:Restriction endonuclease
MTKAFEEFEKQIKRINDVLAQDYATVTWNDRIPNPNNPNKNRQIDITLKRDKEIIHIECRDHKKPQNTKWIEELYGRKINLHATAMVAVSSSGFTEGAILTAKSLGIYLCDFKNLTVDEIKSWGRKTKITFYYYIFSNLQIKYFLDSIKGIDVEEAQKSIFSKPEYNDILFNQIKYHFNKDKEFIFPYGFQFGRIRCGNMQLFDREVKGISLRGDVDKIHFDYECPTFLSFQAPKKNNGLFASVEKSDNQKIEIIKSKSGFSKIFIDLSIIPHGPPNSVFAGIFTISKLPGSKKYPPQCEFIGSQEKEVFINEAEYIIAELKE